MTNLYAEIERATPANSERSVLTTDTGRHYSWRELHAYSARFAALLASIGIERGERVAVQAEKSAESLFLYLACLRAGLVYVPLNTAYRRAELSYFLSDAQPSVIVCDPRSEAVVREIAPPGAALFTLDEAGCGTLTDAATKHQTSFPTARIDGEELAAIIYTSGTTGRSKGAMLTHRNLLANAESPGGRLGLHRHRRVVACSADLPRARPVRRESLRPALGRSHAVASQVRPRRDPA